MSGDACRRRMVTEPRGDRRVRSSFRRRSRVVQARACKAPYTGSIPVAASQLVHAHRADHDRERGAAPSPGHVRECPERPGDARMDERYGLPPPRYRVRREGFNGFTLTVDRFFLMKPRALVEQYVDLVSTRSPGTSSSLASSVAEALRSLSLRHAGASGGDRAGGEPLVALEAFIERFRYGDL